jgi:hypothetical protein
MGNGLLGMDDSSGFTTATYPRLGFTEKKIGAGTNFWLAQLVSCYAAKPDKIALPLFLIFRSI